MSRRSPGLHKWSRKVARGPGDQAPPLERQERGGQSLPLSFAQQRLWFLEQLEPGNTAYLSLARSACGAEWTGEALERAIAELVQRHESLRTTFKTRMDSQSR